MRTTAPGRLPANTITPYTTAVATPCAAPRPAAANAQAVTPSRGPHPPMFGSAAAAPANPTPPAQHGGRAPRRAPRAGGGDPPARPPPARPPPADVRQRRGGQHEQRERDELGRRRRHPGGPGRDQERRGVPGDD